MHSDGPSRLAGLSATQINGERGFCRPLLTEIISHVECTVDETCTGFRCNPNKIFCYILVTNTANNLPNCVEVVPKEVPQTEGRQKTEIEYD